MSIVDHLEEKTTDKEPVVAIDIPDDYLVRLCEKMEKTEDIKAAKEAKDALLLELFNIISILNYCEENHLPYVIDRIKVFSQIDMIDGYPQNPFSKGDSDILFLLGKAIKDQCRQVFHHNNRVVARSITKICFHPIYGKYTSMINKEAYLPLQVKKKVNTVITPELDLLGY